MKLSQLDAAEEAFSQSLAIQNEIFPQGDGRIPTSETTETFVINNHHQDCCFCS